MNQHLSSWRDTPTKQAILEFVTAVTTEKGLEITAALDWTIISMQDDFKVVFPQIDEIKNLLKRRKNHD